MCFSWRTSSSAVGQRSSSLLTSEIGKSASRCLKAIYHERAATTAALTDDPFAAPTWSSTYYVEELQWYKHTTHALIIVTLIFFFLQATRKFVLSKYFCPWRWTKGKCTRIIRDGTASIWTNDWVSSNCFYYWERVSQRKGGVCPEFWTIQRFGFSRATEFELANHLTRQPI